MREAVVTQKGEELTDKVDVARARIGLAIFDAWNESDVADFVRLLLRFSKDLEATAQD